MCGCQTWYLTLREEHKLRLFENIMLRKLLGPKRLERIRGIKLHNEELRNLYFLLHIVKGIKSREMR
jgi:hypothetical protein